MRSELYKDRQSTAVTIGVCCVLVMTRDEVGMI